MVRISCSFGVSAGKPRSLFIVATAFNTILVSGQSDVNADSASADLTLIAGDNITITTNPTTREITFNATVTGTSLPTGVEIAYAGTSAPSGWVRKNGSTIGSATSGATERANADTVDLYTLLWNNYTNTECPVSSGRGASAAADFAANKTLTLPDARGRVSVPAKTGTFATKGAVVGAETHTLSEAELPVVAGHAHDIMHSHDVMGLGGGASDSGIAYSNGDRNSILQTAYPTSLHSANSGSAGGFGSGNAHNNIQPSLITGCILIKL